jgi:hypothetical protein
MFMQILIGGFIALAVIGHVALFYAMFFRPAEPTPQPAERKLRLVAQREAEAEHEQPAPEGAAPILRIA